MQSLKKLLLKVSAHFLFGRSRRAHKFLCPFDKPTLTAGSGDCKGPPPLFSNRHLNISERVPSGCSFPRKMSHERVTGSLGPIPSGLSMTRLEAILAVDHALPPKNWLYLEGPPSGTGNSVLSALFIALSFVPPARWTC